MLLRKVTNTSIILFVRRCEKVKANMYKVPSLRSYRTTFLKEMLTMKSALKRIDVLWTQTKVKRIHWNKTKKVNTYLCLFQSDNIENTEFIRVDTIWAGLLMSTRHSMDIVHFSNKFAWHKSFLWQSFEGWNDGSASEIIGLWHRVFPCRSFCRKLHVLWYGTRPQL